MLVFTPGLMASVTSTPRLAASFGCMSTVHRSRPFISAEKLCSHTLFDRRWRRLTSTSSSRRWPCGVDSTGLPTTVISARI
jgi:hypothetical protein